MKSISLNKESIGLVSTLSSVCPLEDNFGTSLMYYIHHVYIGVHKHLESILLAKKEISFSQFVILTGFSCNEYPLVTQAVLAEHLMLTEATVSRHIGALVAKGLLLKEKNSKNKKSYNLTLTPLGRKTFIQVQNIITEELDMRFKDVSPSHKKVIIENFKKIIRSFQKRN